MNPSRPATTGSRRWIAVTLLIGLLATACGSGADDDLRAQTVPDGETTATSHESTSTTTGKPDTGDLRDKLLSVSDLPTGYSESPPEADGDAEDDEDPSEFCRELASFEEKYAAPESAEIKFQKGEPSLFGAAFLSHGLSRYGDEGSANKAFDAFAQGMKNCKTFEQTDEDGTFSGSFTALSFPKLKDETFAAHLAGKGGSEGFKIDLAGDFIVVRDNRIIMLVVTFGFGAGMTPASELEQIVRAAAAKL